MFCFKCGGSMPDESTVCPQCGATVANAPVPTPQQPAPPAPTAGSAWLNPPSGQPQQYPGQAQAYPGQARPYPAAPPQTDGKAVASLVLGIVSIFLCLGILSGIPAVILGHISLSNIRKSMGRVQGSGMATAGLVMGYIGIAFGLLIVPAIMIPNLLRARMSANASAAASTVRMLNTSQSTYAINYPAKGYAEDLATLGPGPSGSCAGTGTADHACQIDNVLGNTRCTVGAWCTKVGYRFSMSAICEGEGTCKDYVIVATPITSATGAKSFCSTSDGLVRSKFGSPLLTPITAEECQAWSVM
jgi:hypothetical protein